RRLEPAQPVADVAAHVLARARRELVVRERAEPAQDVPQVLRVPGLALGRERAELGLGALDLRRVEQVGELRRDAVAAEELGEERRVERERRRAALRKGGVAVVEELRGVAEQERLREGRGRGRG